MKKIWLSHEPEMLASAYKVFDEEFIVPSSYMLGDWLTSKIKYITDFLETWVQPAMTTPQPFLQVVRYEEINSFMAAILEELKGNLSEEIKQRIDEFTCNWTKHFHSRQEPFHVSSNKLSTYLSENSYAFIEAAKRICATDRSNVMWFDD